MGMSSGGGAGGRTPLSEINVTPLVDVMLVLLIIFMVAAPLLSQNEVPIDLPQAEGQRSDAAEDKMLLSITADRKVYLGETEVPSDRVVEALQNNARLAEEGEVYVQADRNVPYGFVVQIFAAVREAGVAKLGLVTEPLGSERRVAKGEEE